MVDHSCIIVRYAEIALKGKNRHVFEKRLVNNIRDCLKQNNILFSSIERLRGKIVIVTKQKCRQLKNVFGISSYSYAVLADADVNEIFHETEQFLEQFKGKSFRVTVKRANKAFPMNSMELERDLGEYIFENAKDVKVKLKDFDIELLVEIPNDFAYISAEKITGLGGLPLGSSGFSIALIEDEKSLVVAWMMMKRGVMVFPFAESKKDISLLGKYSYGYKIELAICKDVEEFAKEKHLESVIVNDTLPEIRDDYNILTLRPIVAMDEKEIKVMLERMKDD